MRIPDFTLPELEHFRNTCNFTVSEREFFEYRNQEYTLEQIAELMNVSVPTAKRLSKKVNSKIIRVLN